MGARVDPRHEAGVLQPVEGQGAREADDVPAIDEAPSVLAQGRVEMDLGGVLPQPGGHHVLGLLDGHAVGMRDHLTHRVVARALERPCEPGVVAAQVQPFGDHEVLRRDRVRQVRHDRLGGRGLRVAFADHDPAHEGQDRLLAVVHPRGADPHDARAPVGVLLEADHLGHGAQGLARPDGAQEPALRVAEVRHRVERHVRDGAPEDGVEHHHLVERRAVLPPAVAGEGVRRRERDPGGVEGVVERALPLGQGAGRRVDQRLAHAVVLEEAAHASPSFVSGA